jgi:hypothetical protein
MWRYHKELKQWLTKDSTLEPVRISATEERGFYVFFDPNIWQRQRVSQPHSTLFISTFPLPYPFPSPFLSPFFASLFMFPPFSPSLLCV